MGRLIESCRVEVDQCVVWPTSRCSQRRGGLPAQPDGDGNAQRKKPPTHEQELIQIPVRRNVDTLVDWEDLDAIVFFARKTAAVVRGLIYSIAKSLAKADRHALKPRAHDSWVSSNRGLCGNMYDDFEDDRYVQDYDLGEYRYAVAKVFRLLIRAAIKVDPNIISDEDYRRWELIKGATDSQELQTILCEAYYAAVHLWRVYIGPHGSGGVALNDPLADLKELINQFTYPIATAQTPEQINLGTVCWNAVSKIRDGLDNLPHPHRGEPQITPHSATLPPIKVHGRQVTVGDHEYSVEPHHAIWLECLIAASEAGEKVCSADLPMAGTKNVSREFEKLKQQIPALVGRIASQAGKGGGWWIR